MERLSPVTGQSVIVSLSPENPSSAKAGKNQDLSTITPRDALYEWVSMLVSRFLDLVHKKKSPPAETLEPVYEKKPAPKIFSEETERIELIEQRLKKGEPFQISLHGKTLTGVSPANIESLSRIVPTGFLSELVEKVDGKFIVSCDDEKLPETELHFHAERFDSSILEKRPCTLYRISEEDGRCLLLFKKRVAP